VVDVECKLERAFGSEVKNCRCVFWFEGLECGAIGLATASKSDHLEFENVTNQCFVSQRLRGVQMSTMAAVTCNKGALAFPQATALVCFSRILLGS
jgi:hypothetical protein